MQRHISKRRATQAEQAGDGTDGIDEAGKMLFVTYTYGSASSSRSICTVLSCAMVLKMIGSVAPLPTGQALANPRVTSDWRGAG